MNINLFGSTTPAGESLRLQQLSCNSSCVVHAYSRHSPNLYLDLRKPEEFHFANEGCPSVLISFCPIWLLVSFLDTLRLDYPERLLGLRAVVATSTSSTLVKRFASNEYDKSLVKRFSTAENDLIDLCRKIRVNVHIIQPTMIYGHIGSYSDSNLSHISRMLKLLPFVILPSQGGFRQPIHASQLSSVALCVAQKVFYGDASDLYGTRILLGGDVSLSYVRMIELLNESLSSLSSSHFCLILKVPKRIFYFFAAPLILFSPRLFEAVFRIGADLCGFTPSCQILECEPVSFPVLH